MKNLSETPRTDEALSLHYSEEDYFGEDTTKEAYEFARKLERELNELKAIHKTAITDCQQCTPER
jgi:hypothetical protein